MSHNYPRRSQYKYTKKPYLSPNWRDYEMMLRKRGELTLWFSEEAVNTWHSLAEGFLRSVSALLRLGILIPDYSTLSRRSKQLDCTRS